MPQVDAMHEPEFDPFAGPPILAMAPSTDAQREIWTGAQGGDEASLCFNESITLCFRRGFELAAFRAAFADLVQRHEALRGTFSPDGLSFCVLDFSPPDEPLIDLSNETAERRDARFREILAREVETPFNLETGPLFRVRYVRVTQDEYRVVFTAHHIVCDGWSAGVVIKDWAKFYNARRQGLSAELPAADTMTAYARTEREAGADQQRAQNEGYWLAQFSGEAPVLELPYDRARPPVKTFHASRYDVRFDAELLQSVKKSGAKLRSSLFTTLLASFNALLFRLSGQEDIVVGLPAAGQSVGGHEWLVGHCVNMLPVRSRMSAELPFSELLTKTRSVMLDAYDHQAYTFGTLLSKLPLRRDPSRLPLVSVIFNVDRGLTPEAMGFEGVEVELLTNKRHFENFDLFFNAVELPNGIVLECQYNRDLFDEATIRRWAAAYEQLLREVAREPATPLGRLPIVSSEERAQLERWNAQTAAEYPAQQCVHQLIEAQVERTPDAIACVFERDSITYRALNERANQLAHRLRALGVERGWLVGLCVERSPDMLVGMLGILKAGAAYVPLDPGYPLDRLTFMVADARMPVIVSEHKTRSELPLPAEKVVLLDADRADLARESTANLPASAHAATPDDVAYVIYTSGSTGKPKGVLVQHRGLVNLLCSVQRAPGMTDKDVVLAITTLSFDIAASELILPLTIGAQIVLVSREVASDGARLAEVVRSSGVTFIDATPATYRLLLAAGWSGRHELKVICTGEAMPKDLGLTLLEQAGSVWNGYGPTETTVWSTFYELKKPLTKILIGRPVQNTQIYILDKAGQHTPIGVPGEMFIAGAGVARGYLNRPELTTERFIADPFVKAGARMYRTGDVARFLPNGDIECLGRNDNQVKLRGYRIELGEIEDALGQHPAVRQAAVIVREDRPGDARLVAYAVLQAEAANGGDGEFRAHLKRSLPDYMVPATYVLLDIMPLTPSGKIDRKALPAPQAPVAGSGSDFVAPRTPAEQLLATLWQEAFNVPRVSIHDDFFALGGHSLLASQVLARLRRDHGVSLSFRKIFEAPTVAQLAVLIAEDVSGSNPSGPQPIARRPAGAGPAPLSVSQQRIYLLEQLDPSRELVHNLPAAWRLHGPLNPAFLQRGLDEIARRHETLRTTIQLTEQGPVQVVADSVSLPIELIDLGHLPEAEREPAMMLAIARYTRERFDISRLPLFRSYLFRLGSERHVYFNVRHNIIWDGWSFDVFLGELAALYTSYETSLPAKLPALPIAYSDYVEWQRAYLEGPEIAKQVAWWREQLKGDPQELVLPSDRPRPAKTEHRGNNYKFMFTRTDADSLSALARESNATLFMLVFAAFDLMLHRYSGQDEIVVGTPVRARTRPEVENLIGPFINAVVLRTRLSPSMTFRELLAHVRDMTLDSFSHEDMPLERLGIRPPVVRAFFSFQDARTRPPSLGSVSVEQVHVEPPAAANDMMLWMMETRSGLLGVVNYSTELFETETIQRFARGFSALLAAIQKNPDARLRDLPCSAPEDLAITESFGQPVGRIEAGLFDRLTAHADAAPQQVALASGARLLRYGELIEVTNAIGQQLQARGIGPEKLVAVLAANAFERTLAQLGALRAGAAFATLDPTSPPVRLAALCAHLAPDVLLVPEGAPVPPGLSEVVLHFSATPGAAVRPGAFESTAEPAQPAVVFCSFGVDAKPTASVVSREVLAQSCYEVARELGIDAGRSVASLSPAAAAISVLETLAPLLVGARLVLPEAEGGPVSVSEPVSVAFGPASGFEQASVAALARCERVALTSEPSSLLCQQLLAAGKHVTRVAAYPEAGFGVFAQTLTDAAQARQLGRPHFPARVAILSGDGRPQPVGVPGELWVGTAQPARGARWASAAGLVFTGDRARFTSEGSVAIHTLRAGRAERQGHAFDVSEVRAVLERHPSVVQAVVVASRSHAGQERLAAYIVARSGATYTETELRRHLRASVPEAMIPQVFVELDVLPLDAAGQIDLARVPSPFGDDAAEYVAPRSDSERLLASLWCDALEVSQVSVYDNFFDLGGQSLLCFKVISNLEAKTGRRISPRVMLLGTLEQVAAELGELKLKPLTGTPPANNQTSPSGRPLADRVLSRIKDIVRRG